MDSRRLRLTLCAKIEEPLKTKRASGLFRFIEKMHQRQAVLVDRFEAEFSDKNEENYSFCRKYMFLKIEIFRQNAIGYLNLSEKIVYLISKNQIFYDFSEENSDKKQLKMIFCRNFILTRHYFSDKFESLRAVCRKNPKGYTTCRNRARVINKLKIEKSFFLCYN